MVAVVPLLVPLALAPPPTVTPVRDTAAPHIDGHLDDPAWAQAPAFTGFVQKFPAEGTDPDEPTTLRVLYDDRALYLAIDCVQARAPITARLTRRDRVIEVDRVVVDLDTALDRKSAYHFEVNAAGGQADALRFDDTDISFDWDEVWAAAVSRRGDGWSAELRIPLRLLRFPVRPTQTWGFQVRRYVAATREVDELAFVPRDQAGEVSRYGQLGPLERLRKPLGIELRPFAVGRVEHFAPGTGVLDPGTGLGGSLGLDAKWRPGPSLTLDVTANPDFGQVEADEVVLNLTSYETFLPEKRPFFLEGLDLFATPVNVLYTRRIGAVADEPALAPGEEPVRPPGPARIDAAAKLTGRAGALSLGALAALSDDVTVTAQAADGSRRQVEAAPYTLHDAARLRLDLGPRAVIGAIAAATLRIGDQRDSLVGGADAHWRSRGGGWAASAQVLGSAVRDGEPRRMPDGGVVAPGDTSGAAVLAVDKQSGSLVGELSCDLYGRDFDPGDLGYISRQNAFHCFESIGWRDTSSGRWLVEQQHNLEVFHRVNLDGQDLGSGYQLNTFGELHSGWRYFSELHWRPAHLDDRDIGDGTALERAGLLGLELSLHSDPRRAAVAQVGTTTQRLSNGWVFELDGSVALHPHPQLDIELGPTVLYTRGEPRYLGDDGGDRRFGRQRALALGSVLRTTFTFTPALTLQGYAQLFVDRVEYSGFTAAPLADRVVHLDELMPAAPPPWSPDFADGAFDASLVLRWEWRPGSTLYLVYSRAQLGSGAGQRLPARRTLRAPAADAVLLKLTWWMG